jgi:hypothetical protein
MRVKLISSETKEKSFCVFPGEIFSSYSPVIRILIQDCQHNGDEDSIQLEVKYPLHCLFRLQSILERFPVPFDLKSMIQGPLPVSCTSLLSLNLQFSPAEKNLLHYFEQMFTLQTVQDVEDICTWCHFLNELEITSLLHLTCACIATKAHQNPIHFFT